MVTFRPQCSSNSNLLMSISKNKESLPDKIKISSGRYVHNVQFSQLTDNSDSSTQNRHGNKSNSIATSTTSDVAHDTIANSSNLIDTQYVNDVHFPQLGDLSESSTSESRNIITKEMSCLTQKCSNKSNPITTSATCNLPSTTIQTNSKKKARPDYRKLYANYEKNHPKMNLVQ